MTNEENISLHSYTIMDIGGNEVSLSKFKGQVLLIVNTASKCGFTPQYQALEELYQSYRDRGFSVLGFPSNDFGGQEPGSNSEIKEFCDLKYRTTFPMFEKGPVTGDKQPVYMFLTELSDPSFHGDPGWNFVKFLVNKDGRVVGRFSSMTSPTSKKIKRAIEELL